MPFQKVTGIAPDALELCQRAYDDACGLIKQAKGAYPSEEACTAAARAIVDCAMQGERDVEKLKAYALAAIG